VLLCLALAVLCALQAWDDYSRDGSPGGVAARYFTDLSDGDAAGALELAATMPPVGQQRYLTADVLRQELQVARMSGVSAHTVRRTNNSAEVAVSYTLDFGGATPGEIATVDRVQLVRLASSWRIQTVAVPVSIEAGPTGADRLTLAGQPLPSGPVTLFPGAVPLLTSSTAVALSSKPAVTLSGGPQSVTAAARLTPDATTTVRTALRDALSRCMSATDNDPHCPVPSTGRPVPGSLRASVPSTVADAAGDISLSASGGLIEIDATVKLRGSWRAWDFNNVEQPMTGTVNVAVHAASSVDDLRTVYWSGSGGT
jgi:hypothetical protein